jgi:hypothetical protein
MKPTSKKRMPDSDTDDGIAPHLAAQKAKAHSHRGKPNHHVYQLCKQARQAIDAAIICDCGDPIFDDFTACWVDPTPGNSSNLLVTFGLREADPERLQHAYECLSHVATVLRMAVAEAICRKKVPQLRFQILPAE